MTLWVLMMTALKNGPLLIMMGADIDPTVTNQPKLIYWDLLVDVLEQSVQKQICCSIFKSFDLNLYSGKFLNIHTICFNHLLYPRATVPVMFMAWVCRQALSHFQHPQKCVWGFVLQKCLSIQDSRDNKSTRSV